MPALVELGSRFVMPGSLRAGLLPTWRGAVYGGLEQPAGVHSQGVRHQRRHCTVVISAGKMCVHVQALATLTCMCKRGSS
jgi:hypothetical protein